MAISPNNTITASDITTALNGKSNEGHTHDERYYTESEVNNLLAQRAPKFKNYNFAFNSLSPGTYTRDIDFNLEAGTLIHIKVTFSPNGSVSESNPVIININYTGNFSCQYLANIESSMSGGVEIDTFSAVGGSDYKTIMRFTCKNPSGWLPMTNSYEYTILLL